MKINNQYGVLIAGIVALFVGAMMISYSQWTIEQKNDRISRAIRVCGEVQDMGFPDLVNAMAKATGEDLTYSLVCKPLEEALAL